MSEVSDDVAPLLDIAFFIDLYWCDMYGLYLKGWLHCHQHRLQALVVRVGQDSARVEDFHDRPDLLTYYPDHPHVVHGGFEVYVACRPGVPIKLRLRPASARGPSTWICQSGNCRCPLTAR